MTMGLERPRLIGDLVLDKLREAIINKELVPGARLSEAGLAESLQVSKTPVREALLRLRMIGLVTTADGTLRVVLPSPTLVREAYELRAGLEATTAELACSRAPADVVEAIAATAGDSLQCAVADDTDGFRRTDRSFHELVAAASGNGLAQQQVMNARDLCQALRQRDVMTDHASRVCGEAHVAIAQAIAGHDPVAARSLMSEHIHYVMDRHLTYMESGEAPAS